MTTYVPKPQGGDVAALLGRSNDSTFVSGLAAVAASTACDAAKSYTRGVGFPDEVTVAESLWPVILLRAARIATNYEQLQSQAHDGVSIVYGLAGQGWTLQEIRMLDEYRRTAA